MVLCTISRHVSTSSFLLSRSKLGNGSVSENKLRGDLQFLLGMVAECYPDSLLYSLKQPSVSALFSHSKDEIIPLNYPCEKKLLTPERCREWVNFIDDLNILKDQQERAKLVDFVI